MKIFKHLNNINLRPNRAFFSEYTCIHEKCVFDLKKKSTAKKSSFYIIWNYSEFQGFTL